MLFECRFFIICSVLFLAFGCRHPGTQHQELINGFVLKRVSWRCNYVANRFGDPVVRGLIHNYEICDARYIVGYGVGEKPRGEFWFVCDTNLNDEEVILFKTEDEYEQFLKNSRINRLGNLIETPQLIEMQEMEGIRKKRAQSPAGQFEELPEAINER